jgi:hypothetical protein
MRAAIQTGYRSVEVMGLKVLEKPAPGAGQVLVRVCAAGLAAGEYVGMRGRPLPAHLVISLLRPMKDHVVDGIGEDSTQGGPRYDVIMDSVAGRFLCLRDSSVPARLRSSSIGDSNSAGLPKRPPALTKATRAVSSTPAPSTAPPGRSRP